MRQNRLQGAGLWSFCDADLTDCFPAPLHAATRLGGVALLVAADGPSMETAR